MKEWFFTYNAYKLEIWNYYLDTIGDSSLICAFVRDVFNILIFKQQESRARFWSRSQVGNIFPMHECVNKNIIYSHSLSLAII